MRCGQLPRIRHNGRTRGVCAPCESAQARERTAKRKAKYEEMASRVKKLELEVSMLRGVIQEMRLRSSSQR